jgi:hypothetical protein
MLHYLTSDIRPLFDTPHKGNLEEGLLFFQQIIPLLQYGYQ